MGQVSIKYTKTLQNLPKFWIFCFENKQSGNPEANNHQLGEFSPSLVTLLGIQIIE
jgi:hypothetical protein